ncbi:hypothetical protein T552_02317 [Pneumocystis carinii B80]|uniref:Sec1 family protein n=1 Tax=Pneumocystis carinii (strain B80) TaxID=1408658 RepID=A0A0W4ZG40_PNEC8|nr:hypothetical protein T552_02317 [Pneumocystis carinii B80]KTW27334.1 hypothetical protein T552_02317 [Pneumocystis carinii B80]
MSLIDIVREHFISSLRNIQPKIKWKIVIVDNESSEIINNVMSLNDFLEENVASVEFIEQKRQANTMLEAIYFVSPKYDTIKHILNDISKEEKMYSAVHLFFTSGLNGKLAKKLVESSKTIPIKTTSEMYLDFYPLESKVVTFRNSFSFLTLYNPFCTELINMETRNLAKKLASVCITLGELPTIRYYSQPQTNSSDPHFCVKIAELLQEQLDNYKAVNNKFPPESSRPKSVLFIIDRTFDICAPIVHEFTYQAMANDLLPIKNGRQYKYQINNSEKIETKEAVLTETDSIWAEIRHQHIRDAIDRLMGDFNKFYAENSNFNGKKNTSLNDMKNMLYSLPHFQEMRDKYSLHISIVCECMKIFEEHKLSSVGVIEQNCATGLTSEGKVPKTVLEEMVPLLDDSSLSKTDKIRLIMLYIIYKNGLFEGDLDKLSKHSKLSVKDISVLKNLECLGVRVTKPLNDTKSRRKPILETRNSDENSYELSRFTPLCKTLIEKYINGNLSHSLFPSTKDIHEKTQNISLVHGSLRTGKPTWAKKNDIVSESAQRILIFIVGGATYSESRICYELSKTHDRDIILITTNMITTKKWLQNLSMLKLPRESLGLPIDQVSSKISLSRVHSRSEKKSRRISKESSHLNHNHTENSNNMSFKKPSDHTTHEDTINSSTKARKGKKYLGFFNKN